MSVSLSEWRLIGASRMDATLTLRKMNLGELSRALRLTAGVGGTTDATLRIQGTYDRPEASVQIDAPEIPVAWGKIERVKGRIRFHNDGREVVEADLIADGARIVGQGSTTIPAGRGPAGAGVQRAPDADGVEQAGESNGRAAGPVRACWKRSWRGPFA